MMSVISFTNIVKKYFSTQNKYFIYPVHPCGGFFAPGRCFF